MNLNATRCEQAVGLGSQGHTRPFGQATTRRPVDTGRISWRRMVSVVIAVVSVSVYGCGGQGLERDESGAITRAGTEDVFSLEVGDCFLAPEGADDERLLIDSVEATPCEQSHTFEVIARETATGANTYDPSGVALFVGASCFGDNFTAYVGTPVEFSTLKVRSIQPTRQTWEELDDRDVICLVQSEPRTSSVRGTGI